jgi:hypothetical protein
MRMRIRDAIWDCGPCVNSASRPWKCISNWRIAQAGSRVPHLTVIRPGVYERPLLLLLKPRAAIHDCEGRSTITTSLHVSTG